MSRVGSIFEALCEKPVEEDVKEINESACEVKEEVKVVNEEIEETAVGTEDELGEPIPDVEEIEPEVKEVGVKSWREELRSRLNTAFGLKGITLKGNEETEDKELKRLVIAVDCSASMGYRQFFPVFSEIENYALESGLRISVDLVAWSEPGFSAVYRIPTIRESFNSRVRAALGNVGGDTIFSSCVDTILSQVRSPLAADYFLFLTDGIFNPDDVPSKRQLAFMRKIRGKLLWVLDLEGRLGVAEPIGEWDRFYRRNYIILTRK